MTVNHINGVKDDNRLCNLEVCSSADNTRHAVEHLGTHRGERNPAAKLTEAEVHAIREMYAKTDLNQTAVAEHFGVSQITVSRIVRGTYWRHAINQS